MIKCARPFNRGGSVLACVRPTCRHAALETINHRGTLDARLYFYFVVLSIAALWSPSHLLAQGNAQNGATTGGVAGAIIGGVIGHQNDKTTEGVLIGGAVGAIAGGFGCTNTNGLCVNNTIANKWPDGATRTGSGGFHGRRHGY